MTRIYTTIYTAIILTLSIGPLLLLGCSLADPYHGTRDEDMSEVCAGVDPTGPERVIAEDGTTNWECAK